MPLGRPSLCLDPVCDCCSAAGWDGFQDSLVVEGGQIHTPLLDELAAFSSLSSFGPSLSPPVPPATKAIEGPIEAQSCLCHLSGGGTVTANTASTLTGHTHAPAQLCRHTHSPLAHTATLTYTHRGGLPPGPPTNPPWSWRHTCACSPHRPASHPPTCEGTSFPKHGAACLLPFLLVSVSLSF